MILPLPIIHTILERVNDIDIRRSFGLYRKLSGSWDTLKTVCTKHSSISNANLYTSMGWYYFELRNTKHDHDIYMDALHEVGNISRHIIRGWQYMWNKQFERCQRRTLPCTNGNVYYNWFMTYELS